MFKNVNWMKSFYWKKVYSVKIKFLKVCIIALSLLKIVFKLKFIITIVNFLHSLHTEKKHENFQLPIF